MPNILPRLLAAILALLAGVSVEPAAAAEISVLCAGAMRGVLQQLAPDFEKSSGHHLVIEYATAGKVEKVVLAAFNSDRRHGHRADASDWDRAVRSF